MHARSQLICEMPDNVSAAALSMAISAGGAVKAVKTTALMTFEDGIEALSPAARHRRIHSMDTRTFREDVNVLAAARVLAKDQ